MDKNKSILIIIILIAIIISIAGLIVVNLNTKNIEYETLNLSNSCAISVPISNNSTFTEDDGLKNYNDTNLQIISYNKNDLGAWENLGANLGILGSLNQNFKYNHTHQGKNILIHPEENKTIFACLITNNTTGDVLIVASQNEEILYHVIDSVNFTANNNTNIGNNTTTTKNATTNDNTNTQEKTSDGNYEDNNKEKLEFNGKTHEQNIQEAKKSRDEGGQWSGATDEQIEELVSKEERDGGRI